MQELEIVLNKLMSRIQRHPDRAAVLFLVLFSCFFIFLNLGRVALIDWDESIYAGVSREMLERKDFLTLYWNRETFFEKPPLYFWLTSLSYLIFGVNEFAARLSSAVLGVAGIVAIYFFGKEMFGRRSGFAAAMILASTVHWILQSRNGTLDVPAATFIILTLYFFWQARTKPQFWKFSGIFLGLTLITKSAVAVIPLLVMLTFAILEIWWERNFKYYPLKGALLFTVYCLLVTLPWHLAMYQIHGQPFIDEYFFYHILSRTKGIEGHDQPWFWYFIVLQHWARYWYLVFLIAIYFLAGFLVRDGIKKHQERFFLLLWFLLGLALFSSSKSKIEWYIVPLYPAMALLVGSFVPKGRSWLTFPLIIFCLAALWHSSYLWRIKDYNRSIAEVAKTMSRISHSDDALLVANLAPGPPIFYSQRKVVTANFWGLMKKAKDGDRMFVLSPENIFLGLEEEGLTSGISVFDRRGGVILFGRQ